MVKILFVCHGNICRSPMAEFVMKDMVKKAGRAGEFQIASAAVSREEIGNPVYPPARRELQKHGIACDGHKAHQITRAELENYDLLEGVDNDEGLAEPRCFSDNGYADVQLFSVQYAIERDVIQNHLCKICLDAINDLSSKNQPTEYAIISFEDRMIRPLIKEYPWFSAGNYGIDCEFKEDNKVALLTTTLGQAENRKNVVFATCRC